MKRVVAIVEDEPAIRDNYAAGFTREGYAVRTYANRAQAMSAFAARLPDLAVIDISLEDEPEGGFELCRQLRALSAERSEEHTSELQSQSNLVCRLLLEKKQKKTH